jgi:hypothetical protein
MDRLSVAEAARRLGVSQDAIYKRIKRGTIPYEKAEEDKIYVYLDESVDAGETSTDTVEEASTDSVLVAELRDRVRFLEDELQRKDAILMSLVQRVPQLEPAPEPRESPTQAAGGADRVERPAGGGAQEGTQPRSWWRRVFGSGG